MENLELKNNFHNTYKGKKVFLTGHTGFKGTWLLLILKLLGAEVKGYALDADERSLFRLIKGDAYCKSQIADLRDLEKLRTSIKEFQPDFIFHMAAQSLVLESYKTPVETYQTNVMGTLHVLEALKTLEHPCASIIITTDKVYENKEIQHAFAEDDPLGGYDPYSSSKACAEIVVSSWRRSFFNPEKYKSHKQSIASARAGNVIGGGDWADNRIIPDLVRAMEKNEELVIRNPSAIRPWQHVLEPLSGYLTLGMRMVEDPVDFADCYNFGPYSMDTLPVEALIKKAIEQWGKGSYKIDTGQAVVHEANLLQLNIQKAIDKLGWKPRLDASKSIEMTIDWYQNYKNNPLGFTTQQIQQYFNLN